MQHIEKCTYVLLEVNSLTLVVGLVDSSLISFFLKLLQRRLTPI